MTRPASKVNWPILIVGAVIVIPLLALLWQAFGKDPHYIPTATVGKPAADFALTDLDGKSWTLTELRGRPVVINFWSTWCGPCKFEHPVLQREPKRYPDVAFLGALYSDDPAAARRFLGAPGKALPYPSLVDPEGRMALDYGVSGVPETYFIDTTGKIVHKHIAPIDPQTLNACIEVARGKREPALLAACDGTRVP
ncbi:MAG: redoxin domain-containing protein [Myxococcota bacterium]